MGEFRVEGNALVLERGVINLAALPPAAVYPEAHDGAMPETLSLQKWGLSHNMAIIESKIIADSHHMAIYICVKASGRYRGWHSSPPRRPW